MAEKQVVQRFGTKLRALRKRRNLSITELATLLGYTSHGYISEIETGKKLPTIELALKIARLFDVTTDELLKDELDIAPPAKTE